MKLRSNFRTDWPLSVRLMSSSPEGPDSPPPPQAPVFKHDSFASMHNRLVRAMTILLFHKRDYPAYVHRAIYVMMCDTLVKNRQYASELMYRQYLIFLTRLRKRCSPRLRRRVAGLDKVTKEAIARRRWGVLKVAARFLAMHSRAVVTANHPVRKLDRMEFQVE